MTISPKSRLHRAGATLAFALTLLWLPGQLPTARADDPSPAPTPRPAPTPSFGRKVMDVDAMASRPKSGKDLYEKVRDEAFAGYDKRHPEPTDYDDAAKRVIRLVAYLWVWGDLYGENLWVKGTSLCSSARSQGCNDPVLRYYIELRNIIGYGLRSTEEANAVQYSKIASQILGGDLSPTFKLWFAEAAITNLASYHDSANPDEKAPSMGFRAPLVKAWGEHYREWIKAKLPNARLFELGHDALFGGTGDDELMKMVVAEIDHAFEELDPANPVKTELDGDFLVRLAWAHWMGPAAPDQQGPAKEFNERLAKACAILEPLYDKFPKESGTCHAMLHAETGQGKGRARMELWFKRAIAIDPDDLIAYKMKEWYLIPSFYGTPEDIIAYGQECVDTKNWAAAIPTVLLVGVAHCSDPRMYEKPELWARLETVYHEYLSRYPDAAFFRTNYAKHAYDSGRKDIAREQFKIMGKNWDVTVLPEPDYNKIMEDLNAPKKP